MIANASTADSALLGLLGGLYGTAIGLIVVLVTAALKGWTPAASMLVIGLGPLVSMFTALVAGLYPSWKAANVDPLVALRT